MVYEWKEHARFPLPAQLVGERVEAIIEERGVCAPGDLVNEARPVRSPLHPLFEWDDAVAAEAHRRQQARMVINSVRIVTDGGERRAPGFAHVIVTRNEEVGPQEGYAAMAEIVSTDSLRAQVILEILDTIEGFQKRYAAIKELEPLWEARAAVLEQTRPMRLSL